jgi:ABC-type lipoprotein release transport system permease subunit
MILKLAWRNIIRNLRRSLLTVLLSALCAAALIWFQALNDGAHNKMIFDSVEVYTGYIQIHGKGFQEHPNYDNLVYDVRGVKAAIKDVPGIKALTTRLETFALFSGKQDSVGGLLVGIDPDTEPQISRLKRALKEGRYLKSNDTNAAYIGSELAKRLQIKLGDTLVFVSSAVDYSMAADTLVITGIFETKLFEFDNSTILVNKNYMDPVFLADNIASQIVILPSDRRHTGPLVMALEKKLDLKRYEVIPWQVLVKDILQAVQLDNAFGFLTLMILVLIVFFVIMIFTLISIIQRTREIGIMKAIGTGPGHIFATLFSEVAILGLCGIIIGGAFGAWLAWYFMVHPLVITGAEDLYKQYGMIDNIIPSELTWYALFIGIFPVFMINLFSVFYPALKMNGMKPIDAIEGR